MRSSSSFNPSRMGFLAFTFILIVIQGVIAGGQQSQPTEQRQPNQQLEEQIQEPTAQRIISIGGTITETLYALGVEDQIVAIDASSLYPARALEDLPNVGYSRALSSEAILSFGETRIFAITDAGPPEVIQQLEAVGVNLEFIQTEDTVESTIEMIRFLAQETGSQIRGEELIRNLLEEVNQAELFIQEKRSQGSLIPKVAFLYSRGPGALFISGRGTSADAILGLAGGENVVSEFFGYRPLTPEALIGKNPDVLLLTESGLAGLGGVEALARIPALSELDALKNGRIATVDQLLLLGFGPRLGEAINALAGQLHQF